MKTMFGAVARRRIAALLAALGVCACTAPGPPPATGTTGAATERERVASPPDARAGDTRRVRGLYRYMADAASFFDCASGDQFPVLQEGDNAALLSAYAAARPMPGAQMLVTMDARVVMRVLEDVRGVTRPTLRVERFVAIAPAAPC